MKLNSELLKTDYKESILPDISDEGILDRLLDGSMEMDVKAVDKSDTAAQMED